MSEDSYEAGLRVRRQVLGDTYVDRALGDADEFSRDLQDIVTGFAWGRIWTRPDLPLKTRSLVNLGMLAALNRPHELRVHLLGALRNGCTPVEIKEVLLQSAVYAGFPAAIDAFRTARELIAEVARDPSMLAPSREGA